MADRQQLTYHQEKARSKQRTAKVIEGSRPELEAWYQDVGARVGKRATPAGIHYNQKIATSVYCQWPTGRKTTCGKATRASGLCSAHFNKVWRQQNKRRERLKLGQVTLQDAEIFVIQTTLFRHNYKIEPTAKVLGIHPKTLYGKIRRYRIRTPKKEKKIRVIMCGRARPTLEQIILVAGKPVPGAFQRRGPQYQPHVL